MPASTSPPPTIRNRYRLVEWLGQGKDSLTYRARDEMQDRLVVVKFLLGEGFAKEQFLQQARSAARLSHPNLMAIYAIGQENGWDYLVLEYIPGTDLHTLRQQRSGRLEPGEAVGMIRSVFQVLSFAHSQGFILGNIQSKNIRITLAGQVKITGFPAWLTSDAEDFQTDLRCAGALLYEMLTGWPIFQGKDAVQSNDQTIDGKYDPPRSLNPAISSTLEQFILRLLARNSAEKFSSAAEALAALDEAGKPSSQPPETAVGFLMGTGTAHAMAETLEADRLRLAEQIQTNIIGPLSLLLLQAATFEQTLAKHPSTRMAVSVLSALARQVMQQASDLESSLHPKLLEMQGLAPALEALSSQVLRANGLRLKLDLGQISFTLPASVELALYRLTQNVLGALRGQRVSHAVLHLNQTDTGLQYDLTLPAAAFLSETILTRLRQQVESFGGQFQHHHTTQEMVITIHIPLFGDTPLTPREREILQCLVDGLSNKEIARHCSISTRTVSFHLDNIFSKLDVRTRTEAAVVALRRGWTTPA